jgi:SAM-dependent methyltransferase
LQGRYPELTLDKSRYAGAKILDVGFGDGRNWPLLHNLSFDIYGLEISEEILALGRRRAAALGLTVTLKLGTNSVIPFGNQYFDYLLASSSSYYVDKGTSFAQTVEEYGRVLRPGGILLATLAAEGSSIFEDSTDLGAGVFEIRRDPWQLRNGYMFRRFDSQEEVIAAFSPYFECFSIGLCCDNYYGVQINLFLLVCSRK